jgi:tRNA (guanine37-N1)-methyltransferase
MAFRASVLTLYPEMFPGHLGFSLAGKAMERYEFRQLSIWCLS